MANIIDSFLDYSLIEAIISVKDNGPGISKENMAGLFKPFGTCRTGNTGKTKHAGLGPAIAQKIVSAHGGRLWSELKNIRHSSCNIPRGMPDERTPYAYLR